MLYDYYEPSERVELSYSARQTRSLQSVCADCWANEVGSVSGAQSLPGRMSHVASIYHPSAVLLTLLTVTRLLF